MTDLEMTNKNISIPELARAVGKNENYVRQHIRRKHLTVQRNGRNVSVTLEEAARWARERHLSFSLLTNVLPLAAKTQERTARMVVLTRQHPGKYHQNLLTTVRHRRRDLLGPWINHSSKSWTSIDIENGLRLNLLNATLEHCQALIKDILDSATLVINHETIHYALEPDSRRRWAYRNEHDSIDIASISPFSLNSAEIFEYWSLEKEAYKHWLKVLDLFQGKAPRSLNCLRFPLDRLTDRVGNLIIAGALDEITCDLTFGHDLILRLHVDSDKLLPEEYRATVWASFSGNEVLRQEFPITRRMTTIDFASIVDRIGFAIFRSTDGQCIDYFDAPLILQVSGNISVNSSPKLRIENRRGYIFEHEVSLPSSSEEIKVGPLLNSEAIDGEIRQRRLERQVREREFALRGEGNFQRFNSDEFDEAVKFFTALLRREADQKSPIYLADPYFMTQLTTNKENFLTLRKLYLDIFTATVGAPLRILCTERKQNPAEPSLWWSKFPKQITSHVSIRTFTKRKGELPGFHDRFLITPNSEFIITHSLNGWHTDGVTFARIPYDVYSADAERLWSMDIESKSTEFYVREIA